MPADPIEYRILRELQSALSQISVVEGYHHDLQGLAVKLDPDHDIETLAGPNGLRPFIVLEPRPEQWQYTSTIDEVGGVRRDQVLLTLPVRVHWINASEPSIDESRMQTFFRGCADVEQALAMDMTRGGLAVDTHVVRRTYDEAFDSAQVWAMVDAEIRIYRTHGLPNGY